jgi:hypothetical protein
MTEVNPDAGFEDLRRSTRINQAVPITVTGSDAMGRAFLERTTTSLVSAHGCRFASKHFLLAGTEVVIEVPPATPEGQPRKVTGRVAWTRSPATLRDLFQVGVEIAEPGNVWGVNFPPDDWTDSEEAEAAAATPAAPKVAPGPVAVEAEAAEPIEPAAPPGDKPAVAADAAPAAPATEIEFVTSDPSSAPAAGDDEEEPQDLSVELDTLLQQPPAPGAAGTPILAPPPAEPDAGSALPSGGREAWTAGQIEQLRAALDELESQTARIERRLEQVRTASGEISAGFREGLEQRLAEQSEELRRKSAEMLEGFTASLESTLLAAGERALGRLVAGLDQRVEPIIEQAGRALGDLEGRSRQLAAEITEKLEAQQASSQALLEKLGESADEVMHKAFESVSHTADWYQRRAQTAMNTALEKHLAEFEGGARSAAGQVVQSFTQELERFREQFLAQTEQLAREKLQEQWESMGGEIAQAIRAAEGRLEEEAARRVAGFEEQIEARGAAAADAVSQRLAARVDELSRALDERAGEILDGCRRKLESDLHQAAQHIEGKAEALAASLVERLEAAGEAEVDRQRQTLSAAAEESISACRARLENTSNAWMAAAAAQFAEHSRGMMRELAQLAAEQVREATATFFRSFAEALARPPKGGTETIG